MILRGRFRQQAGIAPYYFPRIYRRDSHEKLQSDREQIGADDLLNDIVVQGNVYGFTGQDQLAAI